MTAAETLETPLVAVLDITVRFGDSAVLDNVGMSVSRGEIVTVIGPNGAGKSTLLRLVAGTLGDRDGSDVS